MSDLPDKPAADPTPLYIDVRAVLLEARHQVQQTINGSMVQTYWQIGRLIVEHEQGVSRFVSLQPKSA